MIPRAELQDLYPLTPLQEGLLFHDRTEGRPAADPPRRDAAYQVQVRLRLAGALGPERLGRAWRELAERHGVLRTRFVLDKAERPLQAVLREPPLDLRWHDLSALEPKPRERKLDELRAKDVAEPLDPAAAPPWRVLAVRLGAAEHELLWTFHHALLDGWSAASLLAELLATLSNRAGEDAPPVPARRPFADYVAWLEGCDRPAAVAFWRDLLADYGAAPALPRRALGGEGGHHEARGELAPATTARLAALAAAHQTTLAQLLETAWGVLLGAYGGRRDVVFGTVVTVRPPELPGAEAMVGLLINMVPVRVRWSVGDSFSELLARGREHAIRRQPHLGAPLAEVQPRRGLIDHVFAFESYPLDARLSPGLPLDARLRTSSEGEPPRLTAAQVKDPTHYDLEVVIEPGAALRVTLRYRPTVYDGAVVTGVVDRFRALLETLARDPGGPVEDLVQPGPEERRRLVELSGAGVAAAPVGSFLERFAAQARANPDAVALAWNAGAQSYGQLAAQVDALARRLRAHGLEPEEVVALGLGRGVELITALLAVLRAGGAFLPVDPAYPRERRAFMLHDAGVRRLLTAAPWAAPFADFDGVVLRVDEPAPATPSLPLPAVGGARLAYLIYTSGSTGLPKGAQLHHAGLANFALALSARLGLEDRSSCNRRMVQLSSPSFDASVWEVAAALGSGATLVVTEDPRELEPGAPLFATLEAQRVTDAILPPSTLSALPPGALPALGCLAVGGEACPRELVETWAPGRRFLNAYGPTEATVCVTTAECRAGEGTPAIGRPLPGTRAHVLDRRLRPVPVGALGEIAIGGAGVGRGYRDRPAATAERFVPDPHGPAGARLYRTGDLGRWRANGELEFGGRRDDQVKVRGFRIELGEVEAALAELPCVARAAAVVRGTEVAERALHGFVVAAPGAPQLDGAELRARLRERLPESLVPAQITVLAALPHTPAGKIDRRALAEAVFAPEAPAARGRGALDDAVAATWAAVLGRPGIGPDDEFFALGGHSLTAAQVVSRLRSLFGVDLAVRDLFAHPTVTLLAARIAELRRELGESAADPPQPGPTAATGEAAHQPPLSFGQERLWVLEQLRPGTATYNMPSSVELAGALSVAALEQALGEVLRRHHGLRTRFASELGRPRATVVEGARVALAVVDLDPGAELRALARRLAAAEAARPFDLEHGPLLRATLVRGSGARQVLFWTLHHIASDGWSMSLLGQEIRTLYRAFRRGGPSPLPELPLQYGDFARWQRAALQGAALERQLDHWRFALAGAPPVITLPLDHPRGTSTAGSRAGRGAAHRFRLEPELVRNLAALARRRGATLHMTLLAGYAALLHRLGGTTDLVIGTLAANRRAPEVEGLIGFFVNTLPLRFDLTGDPGFGTLVERVRASALAAYDHEDTPFERIVEALAPGRSPHHFPLVQTILVLQNAPRAELVLEGLECGTEPLGEATAVRFDLELYLWEAADALEGTLLYRRDLFAAATAERLTRQLAILLAAAVEAPARPLSRLALLTPAEREQLLAPRTGRAHPAPGVTVLDFVTATARRHPDRVALVAGGEAVTYAALERTTRRLAGRLAALGAGAGTLVAVAAERSTGTLVALLAVLASGAAYVPIDPGDPAERVARLSSEGGLAVLVGARATLADPTGPLAAFPGPRLAVEAALEATGSAPRRARPRPAELAYVIYTSGSTGRPKGVAVTHEGLALYLAWAASEYAADGGPVDSAFFTSPSFDLTVTSLFLPLLTGGKVVIHPRIGAADTALFDVIRDDAVDVLKLTPAHLALLAAERDARPSARPRRLRRLIVGGEQLSTELAQQALRRFGDHVVVHNEYGPTETVVGCTVHAFDPARDRGAAVPIGRAIAGTRVVVLDRRREPAAPGVNGEAYVAGAGVARGYLGRPGATAERFLPWPFGHGERMYRTGDVVSWDEAGCLRYHGRADREVKIRGVRVDLREIESVLSAQPGVAACTVVLRRPDAAEPGARAGATAGCVRCGLAAEHPLAKIAADGLCQVCRDFAGYRAAADAYFRPRAELGAIFAAQAAARGSADHSAYDALVLYSGGKDSTYALCQLVREMGLKVLVFTLDNGFLSDEALANVARVVATLDVEHVVARVPGMNEIFVDSLERHDNVCNGCFKTIYTTALKVARERGIRFVVTGLSRGQMFETRLAELYRVGVFDPAEAERRILESRKAYHRETDAVGRLVAGDLFADDRIFDQVVFLDFYRYCDVELAEMVRYLDVHVPWVRPSDTGRSTNCLINDLGIAVHKRRRGFHNYALPYSWDVRLGHKTRAEANAELDDEIEPARVVDLLRAIGHPDPHAAEPGNAERLVAYFVGAAADPETLRAALAARLPTATVPAAFVKLETLPLTPHGKIDRAALPAPEAGRRRGGVYVAPRTAIEERVSAIWAAVLAVEQVGVEDDFFELGGHSLLATQVMARLHDAFGVELPMQRIVEHPTVGALAALVAAAAPPTPRSRVEQGVL